MNRRDRPGIGDTIELLRAVGGLPAGTVGIVEDEGIYLAAVSVRDPAGRLRRARLPYSAMATASANGGQRETG